MILAKFDKEEKILSLIIYNGTDSPSLDIFKTLINRATNTWSNAPPEIKELADMLNHGKILQDYTAQENKK